MSHQPPVPEGNQSPYPLHPAPTPHSELPPVVAKTPEKKGDSPANTGLIVGLALGLIAAGVGLAYALTDTSAKKGKKRRKA